MPVTHVKIEHIFVSINEVELATEFQRTLTVVPRTLLREERGTPQ